MAILSCDILAFTRILFPVKLVRQKPHMATGSWTKFVSLITTSSCMKSCLTAEADGLLNLGTSSFAGSRASLLLLLDFGGDAAAVELDGYGVAQDDLGGVAEEVAGGVGGDGVAALEDAEGAALLKLQG
jgi:hypothetical protein